VSRYRQELRDRYPCRGCGTGYLDCAQGLALSLMCCRDCAHPEHWTTVPAYTAAEIDEMRNTVAP